MCSSLFERVGTWEGSHTALSKRASRFLVVLLIVFHAYFWNGGVRQEEQVVGDLGALRRALRFGGASWGVI